LLVLFYYPSITSEYAELFFDLCSDSVIAFAKHSNLEVYIFFRSRKHGFRGRFEALTNGYVSTTSKCITTLEHKIPKPQYTPYLFFHQTKKPKIPVFLPRINSAKMKLYFGLAYPI